MKKIVCLLFFATHMVCAQVVPETLLGIPQISNTNMLATTVGVNAGNVVYNTDQNSLFLFNGIAWVKIQEANKTIVLDRSAGGNNNLISFAGNNQFSDFPINNAHLQVNTSPSTYTVVGNGQIRVLEDGVYLMAGELSTSNMPAGSTKYILAIFINGIRRGYLTRGFVTLPGTNTDFWGGTGVLMYQLNAKFYLKE